MKKLVLIMLLCSVPATVSANGNGLSLAALKMIPEAWRPIAVVTLFIGGAIGGSWLTPLKQIADNTKHLEQIAKDTTTIQEAIKQNRIDEILDILDDSDITTEERRLLERKLSNLANLKD